MNRAIGTLAVVACVASLGGCASGGRAKVVPAATANQSALLFEQVKGLAGTWEMADEQGQKQTAAVFAVSSNGSVVREIMFPGSTHEMTNVYHMDGPTLVMTHYCAAGNQPRMRAVAEKPGTVALKFDSVTNLTKPDESYMGELTLDIKGTDAVDAKWKSFVKGVEQPDHSPVFTMTRKK